MAKTKANKYTEKQTESERYIGMRNQALSFAGELSDLYRKDKKQSHELEEKIYSLSQIQQQSLVCAEDFRQTYLAEKKEAERLRKALSLIETTYDSTLFALVNALDAREQETQAHSHRVMEFTKTLAETAGIEGDDLTNIARGGLLHDIGKIGIPDGILLKPGPLTDKEWTVIRRHPYIGYRMLQGIGFLEDPSKIVLHHQEKFDGTGYPSKLKGSEIPVGARLFVLADTLDSMTADRPYRKALTYDHAVDEIKKFTGTQFDPWAAEVFLNIDEQVWEDIRVEIKTEKSHPIKLALDQN